MFEFLNPWMLAGAAGVAVPVAVHLFHRRNIQRRDWAAMRYLHEIMARRRRRLLLNQLLLLAVRSAIILLVVLALGRLAWIPGGDPVDQLVRKGRVAAVLLIDDSLSASAGRSESRMEQMRALAHAYLDTLEPGDEVAVLRTSALGAPLTDPLYDIDAAHDLIDGIEAQAVASDMPRLLERGLDALGRHFNPHREVVLVSDGYDDGWQARRQRSWAELGRRLGAQAGGPGVEGDHPHLLYLAPSPRDGGRNLAITAIGIDRGVVPADTPLEILVDVAVAGADLPAGVLLRTSVDGAVIDERPLGALDGSTLRLAIPHRFDEPGSHLVAASLLGTRDDLAADDERLASISVRETVSVLLVEQAEADAGPLQRPLGLVDLALDPGGVDAGLFHTERARPDQLAEQDLARWDVVVLGDVAVLDTDAVAAIERFLVAGGGLLVGLGPATDPAIANRLWARDGDGFLPAPVADLQQLDQPRSPTVGILGHPVLAAFRGEAAQEWRKLRFTAYYGLDTGGLADAGISTVLALDDGAPLLVARERGLGRSLLWTSSLDGRWTDPTRSPFVPAMRGAVAWLAGTVLPPRTIAPGDRLVHLPTLTDAEVTAYAGISGTDALELESGTWQGRAMVMTAPLTQAGAVRVVEGERTTWYAVATEAAESRLQPFTPELRERVLAGTPVHAASDPQQVAALVGSDRGPAVEWWPWLVLAALGLMFTETLLLRRLSGREAAMTAHADREMRRAA